LQYVKHEHMRSHIPASPRLPSNPPWRKTTSRPPMSRAKLAFFRDRSIITGTKCLPLSPQRQSRSGWNLAPSGPRHISPRQRPGGRPQTTQALKGQHNAPTRLDFQRIVVRSGSVGISSDVSPFQDLVPGCRGVPRALPMG
jgi:hypothetical protein